jgi:hypothetical protein
MHAFIAMQTCFNKSLNSNRRLYDRSSDSNILTFRGHVSLVCMRGGPQSGPCTATINDLLCFVSLVTLVSGEEYESWSLSVYNDVHTPRCLLLLVILLTTSVSNYYDIFYTHSMRKFLNEIQNNGHNNMVVYFPLLIYLLQGIATQEIPAWVETTCFSRDN